LKELDVLKVELCPASMASGLAPIAGAASAGLTVTVTVAEATDVDVLSVTCSSNCQVPAVLRVPLDAVGNDVVVQVKELPRSLKLPAPGAFTSH